jgi:hypothetical protein
VAFNTREARSGPLRPLPVRFALDTLRATEGLVGMTENLPSFREELRPSIREAAAMFEARLF